MRHGAPFLVKRFAPMMGRPDSARRIQLAHNAYSLSEALEWIQREREHIDRVPYLTRPPFWIERRGSMASRPAEK